MTITVNVGDATVKNSTKIFYDIPLNSIREAEIYTDGSDSTLQAEYDTEKEVNIYRNGTLEFKGAVIEKENTQGGGVVLYCIAQEEELTETDSPVDAGKHSKIWTSTSDNTIFNTIVTEAAGWTTDVTGSTSATLDSFKVTDSMSIWNAMQKFRKTTGKDFYINDALKRVFLLDAKNRTGKAVFNEGHNCGNIFYKKKKPTASKVIVYGKGDGDNQIIGTSGSGTPVKKITDRSVFTTAEANTRAATELSYIQNSIYNYTLSCYNPNEDVETGDTTILNAPSVGLFNVSVDIVKIRRGLINEGEALTIQVSDTNSREAEENQTKFMYKLAQNYDVSQSAMQGSGNQNTWGSGINAKTNYPLKIGFYLPTDYIFDEAGNKNVKEFNVSYDIDKFKSQFGTASFTGSDPQVANDSADEGADVANSSGSQGADVANSSGSIGADVANSSGSIGASVTGTTAASGVASWSSSYAGNSASVGSGTLTDSSWTNITNTGAIYVHSDMVYYFVTLLNDNLSLDRDVRVRAYIDGTYFPSSAGTFTRIDSGCTATIPILMPVDIYGDDVYVSVQTESGDMDYEMTWNYQIIGTHTHADGSLAAASHSHTDGSYAAASHSHGDGTYAAASHSHTDGTYAAADHSHADGTYDINAADLDHISIDDDVGEAGSVNASSVNLYLDFWNTGTTTWDNKHSILATGITIDQDVDISDSNTYPDAAGWWRVRVEPISASADFTQGIVKIKNAIDN